MPQPPFLRCLLLLLLLLGPRLPLRAQGWQPDATLSRLLIHQLVQDHAGLLWVAAEEGLFRYDGYDLVPLAALAPLPPGLRLDRALVLTLDPQQRLWIGSSQGLFRLDVVGNRRLTQVPLPGVGRAPVVVNSLLLHPRTGALWVGYADQAVAVFPVPGGPGRRVPVALKTPAVWLGAADDSAVWAVSAGHRVAYCGPRGGQLRPYRPVAELRPLAGTRPLQLLGTRSLYQEQPDGSLRPVLRWLPGRDEANFTPGQQGADWQWVISGQLVQLSSQPGTRLPQVRLSPADFERPGQLPRPYAVVTDANGLRWAYCPSQRGCYKQRAGAEAIEALPSRPLARYSTRTILRLPDGRLFVSAYGAALVQPADSPQAPLRPLPLRENGRPSEAVLLDALRTPAGQVVFAEENHPFGLFDYRTGQLRRLALPRPDTAFISSLCVLRDSSGAVWGGSNRGLFRLDAGRGLALPYRRPHDPAPLPFDKLEIQKLAAGPGGWLWLATSGGLFRLHPATGRLTHFGTTETGARRLPTDDLLSVAPAADGSAWVATRSAGLLLVHPRQGPRRQLTTATGLPSNTVGTVLLDAQGQVWAGTFAGLVRYDPTRRRLTVLNETDGLADAELNRQSAWRAADGTLYFGGVGGLHRVLPGRVAGGRQRAPRLLLSATIQHLSRSDTTQTRYLPGPVQPALTLAPADAFVELHLALTDYLAPEQARFEYRLPGGPDERWRPLGNTHVLSLRGLPAGDYTVALRGVSGRGVVARNELRVPLTVQAVWWRRPWAWLLAAALVGAGLYGLHRRRLARVRRVERLRSRIAADLHDEVGTLLTRVSLQAELLRQTQPTEAGPVLERLLSNSRQAAGTMRDIVWGIDAQADTVGALLDRMRDHLDQSAAPAGLATELHVQGLRDAQALPPELRQHLYLIFKEAVSNAARHAQQATRLTVTLAREGGWLTLLVQDDGRPTGAATRSGMGRRNMQQRAGLLGGTLTAEARPEGFVVRLRVPY